MSSNSLPTGKSFQSNATKFPHPGLHIATQYPKAEPKKGIMKISPKKNSAIFIYKRCCITKDTSVPVTAAIILLSIIRVTLRRIRNLSGESPHFVSLNIPFLRVQRMSSRSFQTVRPCVKRGRGKHMFGLSVFRPSRQSNISTSGEERFKYLLP